MKKYTVTWSENMRELDNLCVNCWGELTSGSVCNECGYDNDIAY